MRVWVGLGARGVCCVGGVRAGRVNYGTYSSSGSRVVRVSSVVGGVVVVGAGVARERGFRLRKRFLKRFTEDLGRDVLVVGGLVTLLVEAGLVFRLRKKLLERLRDLGGVVGWVGGWVGGVASEEGFLEKGKDEARVGRVQ